MRLSLIDHEEQKRKEAEEKRKKEGQSSDAAAEQDGSAAGPSSSSGLPPIPVSAPIDVAQLQGRASSEPQSSASSRPSLSLENRPSPSPLGSSFGESGSPSPSRSVPQSSPTQGGSHSRSGSATPNLREAALRKSMDTGLPSLPDAPSTSQTAEPSTVSGTLAPANSTSSDPDVGNDPLSSHVASSSVAAQKATAPRPIPHTNTTSLSVATAASELTMDPTYDELPSSPNSPSHRPLLLETPVSEIPEPEASVGLSEGESPRVAGTQ